MSRLLPLLGRNLRRGKRNLVFSSIGILVGTGMFTFFVGLGQGIRENVLNRLYPVNQVEVEPRSVNFMGIKERASADLVIDADLLGRMAALPGVEGVYPKQRSKFQARLWGGADLFGQVLHLEAFFDGLDGALVQDELRANEGIDRRRVREKYRKVYPCAFDADCRAGEICLPGPSGAEGSATCHEREYWRAFEDPGDHAWCTSDAQCLAGQACRDQGCVDPCDDARPPARHSLGEGGCHQGLACVRGACARACDRDAACPPGEACDDGACRRLACRLDDQDDQFAALASTRGHLVGDPDRPCPPETYCAARSVKSRDGFCERPVPVLLNPFILSVYNSTAAVALGVPRINGVDLVLGVTFRILYGNSFFVRDAAPEQQVVKQCVIAGFSTKALEMGVTMPQGVVRRINARLKGPAAAAEYNSVIVQTRGNEDIPAVVERLRQLGFEPNDKSEAAQKAGNMLFILTVLFGFISVVVLGIAAIHITHTFLMIVVQRRREIGVLRSVGATRGHVRALFLAESVLVGLFGAALGNGLVVGLSVGADALAQRYFQGLPFVPEHFFAFPPWIFGLSLALGVVFAVLGALVPAHRAAGLDPTTALRGD
jgi:ABC-type antimicrobial peptide transport system permease subunit